MIQKTEITIPKGAKKLTVKGSDNYSVIIRFNDEHDVHHYFLPNGDYDGRDGSPCNDNCKGANE